MPRIRIHQFHAGSAVGDAVTNGMLLIRDSLAKRGVASDIFVEGRDPLLEADLRLLGELQAEPDDLLLIHHSMGHDVMPFIDAIDCRKILIYHNITPPKYFEESRWWQDYAARGYEMINALKSTVVASICDSTYNSEELRRRGFSNVSTIPMLKDFKACAGAPFNQHLQHFEKPAYHLLFVGRIAGNKGQAELVEFMAAYADSFDYPLHMTLVGHADHGGDGYVTRVRNAIVRHRLQDRVTLTGRVSDDDLYGYYRASDAYVSLSRHEGFGVPIVEAMAFNLPVVALDSSALSSTLGGSGVLIPDTRPATIAEALAPILMSRTSRRGVIAGQKRRLDDFDVDKLTDSFCEVLAPHLPKGLKFLPKPPGVKSAVPKSKRRFLIEGPCETSYSLAIVNRSLAIALDDSRAATATLVPMEGHGDYKFNTEEAEAHPQLASLMTSRSSRADETVVTIRNTYPPRPAGLRGDLRLLNFFWEETEAPREVIDLMERHLDGVLVASRFGHNLLRNSGLSLPIGIIGCGVDHHAFSKTMAEDRARADRPFRFLHVSSGLARKGIEELFLAYLTAFTAGDNVELVIKTYDNETNVIRPLFEAMIQGRPNAPTIHVITSSMHDLDVQSLYHQADAVVLPTRGEGFNLPAAEAMIAGKPVVVTGFSAHMDFCNDDTAWIIDFDFEPSGSHVKSANSNWVRSRPTRLAAIMRQLYTASPATRALRDQRKRAAFKAASSLTWAKTAQKTESFVDSLMVETPSKPKLKVAWISTWNTKCGIASYSEFLVPTLGSSVTDITIFANRETPNSPDLPNVVRAWNMSTPSIDEVTDQIIKDGFDAVVIQYNFGFFSLQALAAALTRLRAANIDTHVFFHKTEAAIVSGHEVSLAGIAAALDGATRLIVHTADDVNRLKSYGLVDNVAQIPHGFPAAPAYDQKLVKRFLGMRDAYPLIASYGFLLPHKGITELIIAFGLLRADYPDAKLLLLNGEYPAPVSADEAKLCRELIVDLGLTDHVVLVTEYMANDDVALMLHAADVIVYPYQDTAESASGAVRLGLAALRPVAVTPLRIFKDVSDYVHTLPGTTAPDMAKGIRALLNDDATRTKLMAKQKAWLGDVNWEQIGKRFTGMMVGLYNDGHRTRISAIVSTPQASANVPDRQGETLLYKLSPVPFVRLACQRILGRDPTATELAMVGEIEAGSATRDQVIARLTATAKQEVDRAGVPSGDVVSFDDIPEGSHQAFIRALYVRLLGREADEGGLSLHVSRLTAGHATRRELIGDFLGSDEFLSKDRVIKVIGGDTGPAEPATLTKARRAKA